MRPKRSHTRLRPLPASHHVRHQLPVPRPILPRHHHALPYPRMARQRRLDLTRLHAEPTHLHLIVQTPHVLQLPTAPAPPIPAPVHPRPRHPTEPIRHEPLRRQPRSIPIPPRHPSTPHPQLSRHSLRHRLPVPVQHVHTHIRQRPPDHAPHSPTSILLTQPPPRHMNRRLRDPIHVHQPRPILPMPREPTRQAPRIQRLPPEDHPPQRLPSPYPARLLRSHQLPERRRRLVQHRHSLPIHQPPKLLRRPTHPVRHHHQSPPVQQRPPHLPYREIKRVRVKQRPHISPAEPKPLLRHLEQTHHVRVRHHHSLRLSRRSRRVHHVRRIFRLAPTLLPFLLLFTPPLQQLLHEPHRPRKPRHPTLQPPMRHQHPRTAVFRHIPKPFLRILRIHRHVRSTRLQHTQYPHHQIQRPIHAQTHPRLPPHTQRSKSTPQNARPAIQIPIRQRLPTEHHRNPLAAIPRYTPVPLVQTPPHRTTHPTIPLLQHSPPLRAAHDPIFRERAGGVGRDPVEEPAIVLHELLHGGAIEEIRSVLEGSGEAVIGLLALEREVNLRASGLSGQRRHREIRNLERLSREVLQGE